MTFPFIISVSREALLAVPREQREAALALGATKWESTWQVVVPFARLGIMGSIFLALARALGETMAVTMVIGNDPEHSRFAVCARLHDRRGDRQRIHRSHRQDLSCGADRTRLVLFCPDHRDQRSGAAADHRHHEERISQRMTARESARRREMR